MVLISLVDNLLGHYREICCQPYLNETA